MEVSGQAEAGRSRSAGALAALALGVFAVILFRTAWLCDDAYITLRTVWNFVHGYGLRWNAAERVQTFTHPLWMMALSGAFFFTREHYFTTLALSGAVSIGAVAVAGFWRAPSLRASALMIGLFFLSRAFVDFSTSGLENPLTHLLLAIFLVTVTSGDLTRGQFFFLSLAAALAVLNRMDTLLFFLPGLALWGWRLRTDKRALMLGAAAWIPFVAWEVFSLVYYGFLAPNPAYAKLGHGWPAGVIVLEGLKYFGASFWKDPVTLTVTLFGIGIAFAEKNGARIAVACGVLLYFAYVIRAGGDFMAGRFFSAAFLAGVFLIGRSEFIARPRVPSGVFAGAFVLSLLAPTSPILSDSVYGSTKGFSDVEAWRVNDERGIYYPGTGLLRVLGGKARLLEGGWPELGRAAREHGVPLVCSGGVGACGFAAGPSVHVLDPNALGDPLLSRLPSMKRYLWIGHFERRVPEGYVETLLTRKNVIADQAVAKYYEKLRLITRGRIFSRDRWSAIWDVNFRGLSRAFDPEPYAQPESDYEVPESFHLIIDESWINGSSEETIKGKGLGLPEKGSGVRFHLREPIQSGATIRLVLVGGASYKVIFHRQGSKVGEHEVAASEAGENQTAVLVPANVGEAGVDSFTILQKPSKARNAAGILSVMIIR